MAKIQQADQYHIIYNNNRLTVVEYFKYSNSW